MGIFIGNQAVSPLGIASIYVGNQKVYETFTPDYLCFTATQNSTDISLTKFGDPTEINLQYSNNGKNWTNYIIDTIITINSDEKIYFKATTVNTTFSNSDSSYYCFTSTKALNCSGNIMSLLDSTLETVTITEAYTFYYLFKDCPILTAPALPATTLADYCYYAMFNGCTSLVNAPALPATTLANNCYYYMFYGCTSLVNAPALPATKLANACYYYMFYGCTSLVNAPALRATTLAAYCYYYMFRDCTSLINIPALPATKLANACYSGMFYGCSKIKLSSTQTGEYQTAYRIPTSGSGTTATLALSVMFTNTGGTFKSSPTINRTYYTSNTVVS